MDELRGVGHFSFWFVSGYFIFKLALIPEKWQNQFWIRLYGPFLPLFLGSVAAMPYLLATLGLVSHEQIMSGLFNSFLFYGVIHEIKPVVLVFSNFHLSVLLDAIVYLLLVLYYIRLVKITRKKYAK